MSYRCLVIDDEKPAREKLKRLLADEADFEVVGEAANADDAVARIDEVRPDLVFLDVEMPEGTGFDVLRRVAVIPHVIFTTAYDKYAVQAFEVRSLDYLLKPFGRSRMQEALERARAAMRRDSDPSERVLALLESLDRERRSEPADRTTAPSRISAKRGAKIVVLDPEEILWFEAEETLVFARTARGRFLVERTLGDLEKQLERDFFRCHRGYLVRLAQIAEILPGDAGTYEIVPRDASEARIPLSRRQARKLKEKIPW